MATGKAKLEEKIKELEQKINAEWDALKDNGDSKKARKTVKSIERRKDQQAKLRRMHFFLCCGKIEGNDVKTLEIYFDQLMDAEDEDDDEWEDKSIWGKMLKPQTLKGE